MKSVAAILKKSPRSTTEAIKVDWPLKEQLIGIEVEVDNLAGERALHPTGYEYMWEQKRDGSLRDGYEYVLRQPQSGDNLSKAISMFFASSPKLLNTPTGSTHIHLDMLEETTTAESVKLMVLLFFMLEPVIFAMYAPEREWCGYTNKLSSAPEQMLGCILNADPETAGMVEYLQRTGNDRYYGLNIKALYKYGSVELRYFPTATNKDELIDWIMLAQEFKRAAIDLGSVDNLRTIMDDENSYKNFINQYFGRWNDAMFRVVPYYAALQAFNKAQAIASSWQHGRNARRLNVDLTTLFTKGRYSKFAKKIKPDQSNELSDHFTIIDNAQTRAPAANNFETGHVLYYNESIYVTLNGVGWTPIHVLGSYTTDVAVIDTVLSALNVMSQNRHLSIAGSTRVLDAIRGVRLLRQRHEESTDTIDYVSLSVRPAPQRRTVRLSEEYASYNAPENQPEGEV